MRRRRSFAGGLSNGRDGRKLDAKDQAAIGARLAAKAPVVLLHDSLTGA